MAESVHAAGVPFGPPRLAVNLTRMFHATVLRFSISRTVPASAEAVWQVLGDFGTEHRWTSTVVDCRRNTATVSVGTVRTCALPRPLMGRMEAIERLVEYEPGSALTYELDGPAGPFATVSSRWSTRPVSARVTEVTVEGTFTPRHIVARAIVWPVAKPVLRRLTMEVLAELEAFLLAQRGVGARGPSGA